MLNLAIGSFFGILLSIIFMTLSEFVGIDFRIREESQYLAITYLLAFAIFITSIISWMKYKGQLTLVLFILIIIGSYGAGKVYSGKIIKPFKIAENYNKQAYSIFEKWSNKTIKQEEAEEYLKDQESMLKLLKNASQMNFGYEKWIKKYYETIYEVKKEMYEHDKKSMNGEIKLSEDQITELSNSYSKRLKENIYIKPFWMDFYAVDPT